MLYSAHLELAKRQMIDPPREEVLGGLRRIFIEQYTDMSHSVDEFTALVKEFPYITPMEFAETWRLFADPNQIEDLDPKNFGEWSKAARWLTAHLLRSWLNDYCWESGEDGVGATIAVLDDFMLENHTSEG